jgi:hypothetical protein
MRFLALFLLAISAYGQQLFWPFPPDNPGFVGTNVTFGLVNWWKFDESTGTNAADSADSATGTNFQNGVQFAAKWVPGMVGNAVLFTAITNNYFQLSTNCSTGNGAFTITYWTFRDSTNGLSGHPIDDNDEFLAHDAGFSLNCDSINFDLRVVCSVSDCLRGSLMIIPTNHWLFCVATWDGTIADATKIHLYTNMVEMAYNLSQNGIGTHVQNTTTNRAIGRRSAADEYFDGTLDDIRIYNRVIDLGEQTNLFYWRGGP